MLKFANDSIIKDFTDWLAHFYLFKLKGFDPEKICVCTAQYEGTKEEVKN